MAKAEARREQVEERREQPEERLEQVSTITNPALDSPQTGEVEAAAHTLEHGSTSQYQRPAAKEKSAEEPKEVAGVLRRHAPVPTKLEAHVATADTEAEESGDASEAGDAMTYRYRDSTGLVFGPMGPTTLVNLLRARSPGADDKVSRDQGPWQGLSEVSELDLEEALKKNARRRSPRHVASDQPRTTEEEAKVFEPLNKTNAQFREGLDVSETDLAPPPVMENEEFLDQLESPVGHSAPSVAGDVPKEPPTLQELKEQYASYEGDLRDISIARILARLHLVKVTGRLFVSRGDIKKSIFFRHGEPIFAESNKREELLGQFLSSRDLINEKQLQDALDRLSEWGGRLGDALVAVGALPAHSIFEHLSDQMSEKILDIFEWEDGYYGYYENQEPDAQAYSLGLNTYQILVKGCRERVAIDDIRKLYKYREIVGIFRNDPPPFDVERLGLRARELRVLHQLEPGDTLKGLLDKFQPEQHETVYRSFYLFHQTELVSFEVTEKVNQQMLPEREPESN